MLSSLLSLDGEWCSRCLPFSRRSKFQGTKRQWNQEAEECPMFPTKYQAIFSCHRPGFPPSTWRTTHSLVHQRWGGGGLTYSWPVLPMPFKPISAGLAGLPFQLEERIFKAFSLFFSRDKTGRPAEKSNYNPLSWWNPITTSPAVKANPFDTKRN